MIASGQAGVEEGVRGQGRREGGTEAGKGGSSGGRQAGRQAGRQKGAKTYVCMLYLENFDHGQGRARHKALAVPWGWVAVVPCHVLWQSVESSYICSARPPVMCVRVCVCVCVYVCVCVCICE